MSSMPRSRVSPRPTVVVVVMIAAVVRRRRFVIARGVDPTRPYRRVIERAPRRRARDRSNARSIDDDDTDAAGVSTSMKWRAIEQLRPSVSTRIRDRMQSNVSDAMLITVITITIITIAVMTRVHKHVTQAITITTIMRARLQASPVVNIGITKSVNVTRVRRRCRRLPYRMFNIRRLGARSLRPRTRAVSRAHEGRAWSVSPA